GLHRAAAAATMSGTKGLQQRGAAMRRLILSFVGDDKPELHATELEHELLHDESGAREQRRCAGTDQFQWRHGPHALALFLVRAVSGSLDERCNGRPFKMSGNLVKPLVEVLKRRDGPTRWPLEMFGYDDSRRDLLIHRFLEATTPRGVPHVELQVHVLSPRNIHVLWNQQDISRDPGRLETLAGAIANACFGPEDPAPLTPAAREPAPVGQDAPDRGGGPGGVAAATDTVAIAVVIHRDF